MSVRNLFSTSALGPLVVACGSNGEHAGTGASANGGSAGSGGAAGRAGTSGAGTATGAPAAELVVDVTGADPTAVVVLDDAGNEVVAPTSGATFAISAEAGHSYLVKKSSDPTPALVQVTGTAATAVKKLGSRTIGVP